MNTKKKRVSYTPHLKAEVALIAAKGIRTTREIATEFCIHPNSVSAWKKTLLLTVSTLFEASSQNCKCKQDNGLAFLQTDLIAQMEVEQRWLKKTLLPKSIGTKRNLIDPKNREISVNRQCRILGLSHSTYYSE